MALLVIVSALTFLDRLNLSIAGKFIQDEFHLSTQTMGWILSAFVLGYALFQVPGGWLADRYGPRAVVTGAILWWSIFSAATAIAPRLPFAHWFGLAWSFAIVRFLIGLGEGATYPNANKIVSSWMGAGQRGYRQQHVPRGHWCRRRGYARINCLGDEDLGMANVLLCLRMHRNRGRTGWHFYVRDRPSEHPGVNLAELDADSCER